MVAYSLCLISGVVSVHKLSCHYIEQWQRGTDSLTLSLRETEGMYGNVQSVWRVLLSSIYFPVDQAQFNK